MASLERLIFSPKGGGCSLSVAKKLSFAVGPTPFQWSLSLLGQWQNAPCSCCKVKRAPVGPSQLLQLSMQCTLLLWSPPWLFTGIMEFMVFLSTPSILLAICISWIVCAISEFTLPTHQALTSPETIFTVSEISLPAHWALYGSLPTHQGFCDPQDCLYCL